MVDSITPDIIEIVFSYLDYGDITNLAISNKANTLVISEVYNNQDFWCRKLANLINFPFKLIPDTTWRDLNRQFYMIHWSRNSIYTRGKYTQCMANIVMYYGVAQVLVKEFSNMCGSENLLLAAAISGNVYLRS